ncbi:hypothetical protein RTG_01095 [Rhodotorula toruloides ATCC 204091]|uniref:Uncharacterized protein n=1 Tax=Rhodotorula toruloides TaxID=5286 RepID=A0A0K3C5V5_RHOTO|nr:hypothetical protein RTG_01095 [Rhodotorula toruloides ATCC 204091]PRQ77385.1 hypothetical protein AAT19DRAFT_8453 [Rhodotorula toruloides]
MPPRAASSSASPKKGTTTKLTSDPTPLALPALLKLLTTSGPKPPHLSMSQAIAAASKLVPGGYTSHAKLRLLNQADMVKLGIADEEIRKGLMAVIGKGGGKGSGDSPEVRKKRTRESDLDRPLPTRAPKETVVDEDFDFEEIEAEEALAPKACLVNRAPVMTAWACVVAERLGFRRQEALSIAHVFTDLNATSKGVSLGLMGPEALKVEVGPSQPFVDILGRKVPVLSTQTGEWRAISKGHVADPSKAFAYMRGAFRQQLGAVVGAMRLLAASFSPKELNEMARNLCLLHSNALTRFSQGYHLYLDFRPESDGWGKKADLRMSSILDLRRHLTHGGSAKEEEVEDDGAREVKREEEGENGAVEQVKVEPDEDGAPEAKRVKREEEEEDVKPVVAGLNGAKEAAGEKDEFDELLDEDDDLFAAVDV